jgi:hypothetical protein
LSNRATYCLLFYLPPNGRFYGVSRIGPWQTKPESGLFSLRFRTSYSQVRQNRGPAARVCTRRVHQREAGVNESRSVRHEYDKQQ